MGKKNKLQLKRYPILWISYILLFVLLTMVALDLGAENTIIPLQDIKIFDKEGTTKEISKIKTGDQITILVPLNEEEKIEHRVLCFETRDCVVNVYFGQKHLYSYGEDIQAAGNMVGTVYVQSRIPEEAWGHNLTVILEASENGAFSKAPIFRLYEDEESYRYFLDKNWLTLAISFFLLISGGMGLILLFGLKKAQPLRRSMLAFALFILTCGAYVLLYCGVYRLFWDSYIWSTVRYLLVILVPITFLLFYYYFSKESKAEKGLNIVRYFIYLWIALFIISSILHFTNILHFPWATNVWHIGCFISMALTFYLSKQHIGNETNGLVFLANMQFLLWAALDIVRFLLANVQGLYWLQEFTVLMPIGMLMFVVVVIWYFIKRLVEMNEKTALTQKEIEHLERELKENYLQEALGQIQPHFLYNTLSSIRMITKTNPEQAYDLLLDFTVYLRGALKLMSKQDMIPFDLELKNINAYLNIEKMRLEGRLEVFWAVQAKDFNIPPLSIQPLVENAVKHGIFPKGKQGGYVRITTAEELNSYTISVQDNGVGFEASDVKGQEDSIGLNNLIYRIETLTGGTVEIASTSGKGTDVIVRIPKGGQRD